MGIWSSIHDFYLRWRPEIRIYGIGLLLFFSAVITGRHTAGSLVLAGMLIMDAMRRWGEPWRQVGEQEFERRRRANQELWAERFSSWLGRNGRKEPPPAAPPTATTLVIPNPARTADEDDLPESPAAIVDSEKPAVIIPPPVTHDT